MENNTENWFAICTRYKREKYVLKLLIEKNVHAYVPLQKQYRYWGGRKRIVHLPLISSYVFVKIKPRDHVPVLETENVLRFVKVSKKMAPIPESEIDTLKRVVGDLELHVHAEPISYAIGDEVEIRYGTLTGMTGKLVETKNNKFVIIELQAIGYELRLTLPNNYLKKITD